MPFGGDCGWLAVRTSDQVWVLQTITDDVGPLKPTGWDKGVKRALDGQIAFAFGPVRDWILVLGGTHATESIFSLEARVTRMSRTFGEVQGFLDDQHYHQYRWVRAVDGVLVRSFWSDAGRVRRDHGECAGFEAPGSPVGEADVLRAAAAWSVDPATLVEDDRSVGLACAPILVSDWGPVEPVPIAAVASRTEAELHAIWLSRQGCPRCRAERIDSNPAPARDDGYDRTVQCETCGVNLLLRYTAGDGWATQPDEAAPRITSLARPSPLLPPSYLLEIAEREAENASLAEADGHTPYPDRPSFASRALAALDELEKHRDFVIPNRARFAELVRWLRTRLG